MVMEEPGSKVHKLESSAERIASVETPVDIDRGKKTLVPPAEEIVRYVAIPHYDTTLSGDEDSIDLMALWSVVQKYKIALLSVVLLALLLSTATALLMSPVYRAELIMAPAIEERPGRMASLAGQFGGLASLAGVSISSRSGDLSRILATLQSRAFLVPFMKEEKILSVLSAQSAESDLSVLDAYSFFTKNVLDVRKDTKTGLVTLSIEWKEPTIAALWANSLVFRFNEHQRKSAIREAEQSIEFLNSQLQQTGVVNMQQAIYRLIESQTRAIMLANVKKEYVMQVIDPAIATEKPVAPKVRLIIILGLVLGLMLGVLLVFILHVIENVKLQAKPVN